MSKSVLLVSYYFPPSGMAGIDRPVHLFKYLPQFGWDVHVLTVKPIAYRAYEHEFLKELDQSKIFRSGSLDPQRLLYLMGVRKVAAGTIKKASRLSNRFFPDSKIGWVRSAIGLGRTLMENYRYNAIITTSPPVSAHLIGMQLAKEFGSRWIADFRDAWTTVNFAQSYKDNERRARASRLLDEIRSNARLVTVTPGIAKEIQADIVIENSFDVERAKLWQAPTQSGTFTIGVLGTVLSQDALEPLFAVLSKTFSNLSRPKCRVVFVGDTSAADIRFLAEKCEHFCEVNNFELQNRRDSITILSDAHVMYIGLPPKTGPHILTGRVFDVLASGRPILGYCPSESDLARLLNCTGNACVFSETCNHVAVEWLKALLKKLDEGRLVIETVPHYAEPFTSLNMARRYAAVLESLDDTA